MSGLAKCAKQIDTALPECICAGDGNVCTIAAEPANSDKVLNYIENELLNQNVPLAKIEKILLASGEIFANIAMYAYEDSGVMQIDVFEKDGYIFVRFMDKGKKYNPLIKADPDVSCEADKRKIGGLGIFIIKKLMDIVKYERKSATNILIIGIRK